MNTPQHDRLTRTLSREADEFHRRGGSELEIGQVLARAGEIRRGRRMRATMLMAACVLAVAVPIGVVSLGGGTSHEPPPAPAPKVDRSPITLEGLKTGDAPKIVYVESGTVHQGGTSVSSTDERYVAAAEYDGGVMIAVMDDLGTLTAHALAAGPKGSWPMSGDFTVSSNGSLLAFVQPDGTPVVVSSTEGADDATVHQLPRIPRGEGFDAVAVTGDDCSPGAGAAGCTVWVNSHGQDREAWVSTSGGAAKPASASFVTVSDVATDGRVSGFISYADDGSCSAVEDGDGAELWSTCDHHFRSFSPDGTHLSAFPAYADGPGSSQMAVLDARTGAPVLDLQTVRDAFIPQVAWEDDTHLLVVVGEGQRAAILRIGLDGSREYAVPPVSTEPYEVPFTLPSR